jgi:hypothetical protein
MYTLDILSAHPEVAAWLQPEPPFSWTTRAVLTRLALRSSALTMGFSGMDIGFHKITIRHKVKTGKREYL